MDIIDIAIAKALSGGGGGGGSLPTPSSTTLYNGTVTLAETDGIYTAGPIDVVIELDKTYQVTWNGVSYTVTPTESDGDVYIGSTEIWEGGTGDYPFIIDTYESETYVSGGSAGDFQLVVKEVTVGAALIYDGSDWVVTEGYGYTSGNTVHSIDAKYIPMYFVSFTYKTDNDVTISDSFDNIVSAIQDGKYVVGLFINRYGDIAYMNMAACLTGRSVQFNNMQVSVNDGTMAIYTVDVAHGTASGDAVTLNSNTISL